MKTTHSIAVVLFGFALGACDGQQYVSPDTVALSVAEDGGGPELVHRCDYVPVLLGDAVQSKHVVDSELQLTFTATRDVFSVTFNSAAGAVEPFVVKAQAVLDGPQTAENPPSGYTVQLSSRCSPDE
jgi:hypothetical protein